MILSSNRQRAFLACLFALIVCVGISSCGGKKEEAKGKGGPAGPAPAVVVATVERKTVPIVEDFTARTVGSETVELRARVQGFLIEAPMKGGEVVRKDQVLFRIDPRNYQAQLEMAKAKLAQAEANLAMAKQNVRILNAEAQLEQALAQREKTDTDVARLAPLAKAQAVPQQDLDNALAQQKVAVSNETASKANLADVKLSFDTNVKTTQAAVLAAAADVKQAELDLSYCTIATPIDGVVGTNQVDVGNLVGAGSPTLLSTVSTANPMKVTFAVSESEYLRIRKKYAAGREGGTPPLEMILADGSKFDQKGRITAIDRAVDEKLGTLQIQSLFPNPALLLKPGQFGRVSLPMDQAENAVLVPQTAVSQLQSANVVFVVGADNKIQLKTVTLGQRYQNFYVVESGLSGGERIVVEGTQKARPGQAVTPMEKPASSAKGS